MMPEQRSHPIRVAWRLLWVLRTLAVAALLALLLSIKETQSLATSWREVMAVGA